MSTQDNVWTMANALIELTKILLVVVVHGCIEQNIMKIECGGARLDFEI